MNTEQYKGWVRKLFESGKASNAAWDELGECILVASENGDILAIDDEISVIRKDPAGAAEGRGEQAADG